MSVRDLLEKRKLQCGRILSFGKKSPACQWCVWNANIVTRSEGKVWFGDLNITLEGPILKEIAEEYGEPIYVLREMDCRFETEGDSIDTIIPKAIWSTVE